MASKRRRNAGRNIETKQSYNLTFFLVVITVLLRFLFAFTSKLCILKLCFYLVFHLCLLENMVIDWVKL